jgi:hypothetical protein
MTRQFAATREPAIYALEGAFCAAILLNSRVNQAITQDRAGAPDTPQKGYKKGSE